jgi:hypothetical protein
MDARGTERNMSVLDSRQHDVNVNMDADGPGQREPGLPGPEEPGPQPPQPEIPPRTPDPDLPPADPEPSLPPVPGPIDPEPPPYRLLQSVS